MAKYKAENGAGSGAGAEIILKSGAIAENK